MKKSILKAVFAFALVGMANLSMANNPCDINDPFYDPEDCANSQNPTPGGPPVINLATVPVDGGASYLAIAGIAYGVKRYRNRKKK